MCWALIHCIDSMFSSNKKQHTQKNQYSQIPTNVEIRGPESGKLIEISNAINSEFGNNSNLRVFSKVVEDVQYYQVNILLIQGLSIEG